MNFKKITAEASVKIVNSILTGIMIVLSIIILILSLITISEISPLSSDYMLAQAAREITLENNPFSKVSNLINWELGLMFYSFFATTFLAFNEQGRKTWLAIFWLPGIFTLLIISG